MKKFDDLMKVTSEIISISTDEVKEKLNDPNVQFIDVRDKNSFEKETIKAKYLKVSAKTVGSLPQEHPAAGSDAWIFVDEIIIN